MKATAMTTDWYAVLQPCKNKNKTGTEEKDDYPVKENGEDKERRRMGEDKERSIHKHILNAYTSTYYMPYTNKYRTHTFTYIMRNTTNNTPPQ